MLTREALLAKAKPRIVTVEIPHLEDSVRVRGLTGRQRDEIEQALTDRSTPKARTNIRARVACYALCDEEGERLFSDADVAKVGELDGAVLQIVWEAALRLSGMVASSVEEAEGN